jgi:hypothetical protein
MFKPSVLVAFAVLSAQPLFAADQPASTASAASAKELVTLMAGRKAFDAVFAQMDNYMDAAMKQAAGDRQLSPEQQKIVDDMRAKMIALVRDTLNWDSFEPKMEEIYQKSFSQSEMDGMLKFYKSPAGKAVIAKMPVVMQNTMQVMQGEMGEMMPKMQQLIADTASQMKALDKSSPDKQTSGSADAASQK